MDRCPKCGKELNRFSGCEGVPEGCYCEFCQDYLYDYDGEIIGEWR